MTKDYRDIVRVSDDRNSDAIDAKGWLVEYYSRKNDYYNYRTFESRDAARGFAAKLRRVRERNPRS